MRDKRVDILLLNGPFFASKTLLQTLQSITIYYKTVNRSLKKITLLATVKKKKSNLTLHKITMIIIYLKLIASTGEVSIN